MTFRKILVANRGEIACRVMRTAHRLGYRTVAVYSHADANALHVKQADEAFLIGGPRPVDSYLRGDVILDIARRSGAEAVHPGYGFLSENEAFAAACEKMGIAFIGPTPEAIKKMGSKSHAKTLMQAANVPVVPGIMPFHNYAKIAQFAQRDGIEIPRWVALKMEGFLDDAASIRAFGLDVIASLCERLIAGGAPGIHFYTMNQSTLTAELCRRLARD